MLQEQFGDKPSERRPGRSDLVVLVAHNDDPTDQMFVFFPDDPKIGIKTIKTYCTRFVITIFLNFFFFLCWLVVRKKESYNSAGGIFIPQDLIIKVSGISLQNSNDQ